MGGNDDEPRRITGALKLMFGRFGGGWKEAGSPLVEGLGRAAGPCQAHRLLQGSH